MSAFSFFLLKLLCSTRNIPRISLFDFLREGRSCLKTHRVENLMVVILHILQNVSAFYAVVSSRKRKTLFSTLNHTLNDQQNNGCYSADISSFFSIRQRPRRMISTATRASFSLTFFVNRDSPTETTLFHLPQRKTHCTPCTRLFWLRS